ncbi:aconitase X catalytic domain-containing protein, partial [Candidatus Bathyarchaeota archaeon]|nr:aconitase X catalytic domain-containing protein [Candidatus Bathyarchaeota archaeon]
SVVTFGSKPLFYIKGITPASEIHQIPEEKIIIDENDLKNAYDAINDETEEIDFVCIGCPHASIKEIAQIANLLSGKKISSNTEFWVATSRSAKQLADNRGYTKIIEDAGAKFACDTCMAVAPLKGRFRAIATTSAKGCYYSRHNKMLTKMGSLKECINAGVKGKWS